MTKRYVATGEAADHVGVSTATLLRWVHDGLVKPATRTRGGHYRWDLAELQRQLDMPPNNQAQSHNRETAPADPGAATT